MKYDPTKPAPPLSLGGEDCASEDSASVRALLARARDFLDTCRRDPRQALDQEDPAELLAQLDGALDRSVAPEPDRSGPEAVAAPDADEEPPAGKAGVIRRLRPRRSA